MGRLSYFGSKYFRSYNMIAWAEKQNPPKGMHPDFLWTTSIQIIKLGEKPLPDACVRPIRKGYG